MDTEKPIAAEPDALQPLSADKLRRRTRLSAPDIELEQLADGGDFLGQARAQEAIELAAAISAEGFNLFVAAPAGADALGAVKRLLTNAAANRERPGDWAYVFDFDAPRRPRALALPSGRALGFRKAVRELIVDLKAALPAAFEKPDFQARRRGLEDAFRDKQEDAFERLGEEGRQRDVAIIRTPMGFSLGPLKDGDVMEPEAFNALPEAEQERRRTQMKEVQGLLAELLRTLPKWERELREGIRTLERETAEAAITQSIEETKKSLSDVPPALDHLDAMRRDLLENAVFFANVAAQAMGDVIGLADRDGSMGPFDRYDVNVLVGHDGDASGAPVVEEAHPTLANLVGAIEHRAEEGVLTTNFMLIKPGALHTANGGFLILDAHRLLRQPLSWDALKRALHQGQAKIESLGEVLNLSTTITLDPEPIPIDLRVVLVGDPWIYHVLAVYDPDFTTHFKLLADFETDAPRSEASEHVYAARLVALAKELGLIPPEIGALERLVEEAARAADDAEKLTLVSSDIRDLLIEAAHHADVGEKSEVSAEHVEMAIAARKRRLSRIGDRMQENVLRDIALIDTDGAETGQVNGLSVFQIGGFRFGRPTRITARSRPGAGRVVDIEREARLGGPIHSKGVMILTGYLAGRYALDQPMSLLASLVFEQSYGGVEGDSASLAELCALLSDLAELPLRQDLGVTGAVNQRGDVQAIGAVNEKVEGFFDICAARELTGRQGVIIPSGNVQHLMLNEGVVEACRDDTFAVYAVRTVDEVLALLTGEPADTVHARIEARLGAFADVVARVGGRGEPAGRAELVPEAAPPSEPPGKPPGEPPEDPPRVPPSRSAGRVRQR